MLKVQTQCAGQFLCQLQSKAKMEIQKDVAAAKGQEMRPRRDVSNVYSRHLKSSTHFAEQTSAKNV